MLLGKSASSLVQRFISGMPVQGLQVLDLGCGERKNAHAFACAGASVVAVDCSEVAVTKGRREFVNPNIKWILSDAVTYLSECGMFDLIIMYSLLHCLPSLSVIRSLIRSALCKTRLQGHHIVATFDDGPHNLSADPGFSPTLASHEFYLLQYTEHEILSASSALLHEDIVGCRAFRQKV
jgi:tellurite methyltransferase